MTAQKAPALAFQFDEERVVGLARLLRNIAMHDESPFGLR
jgi:hypothetical protein